MPRYFDFARKMVNGQPVNVEGSLEYEQMYEGAKLPEYSTKHAAGADFFCAEDVEIPSMWSQVIRGLLAKGEEVIMNISIEVDQNKERFCVKPTMVHTGIKACMNEDEVLELYNRSSNPKKLGLILANGVGVVDADYFSNCDNDGEIMFAFYNVFPFTVRLKAGDKVGQGVFKKFLRPDANLRVRDDDRVGGFGSTGSK